MPVTLWNFRPDWVATVGPNGRKLVDFVEKWYPAADEVFVSSAYRPFEADGGTWSHHNGQIYNGSPTAAVDFVTFARPGSGKLGKNGVDSAKMRDLAKWLYENFGDLTVEMFHTTPFSDDNGFNIRAQKPSSGIPDHDNHVHYATSAVLLGKMESRAQQKWGTAKPKATPRITPLATTSRLFGWDASDFDHTRGMRAAHITAAAKEGISFFTHKVTEGTRTVHTRAGEKFKAAKAADIPFIGAYIVPRTPGNNGHGGVTQQVEFALAETTKQFPGWATLPGWFWQVDLEHWSDQNGPYDLVPPWVGLEMCEQLEKRTTKSAVLYAPNWCYGGTIGGGDPLWSSDYGPNAIDNFKDLYEARGGDTGRGWVEYSGRVPAIWQFGSRAVIGGQQTCDANAFRGTVEDFAKLINAPAVV